MLLVFSTSFALIGARLFHLQVVRGESLREIAEANRTSLLLERAPRGLILDRNEITLADSKPTFVVLFTSLQLKQESFEGIIKRLSLIFAMSEDELKHRLESAVKHSSMSRLMDRASRSIAFALAEQRPNLPGISVVTEMQRRYPYGSLASHTLGYLGQISMKEFNELREEGYQANWLVGKIGLEKIYDTFLRGEHGGMRIEVDASGHSLKVLDRKEPVSGYQLKTTINKKIQEAAEIALSETQKAGAVVALDPRNGEILALASLPSFDPNLFVFTRGEQAESSTTPHELLTRSDLPLFNRAIQGTYPPGSVFKIIDTAAALDSHKLNPEDSYYCPGYFWLGTPPTGKKFLCWKPKGHGKVSLTQALINSCNVYYYHLGLKVGPDAIENMARKFGLGKETDLELPGEKRGFIPGRGMFKTERRRWFDGDTLNMAIGQGTILITPIQAAQLISVVANRGKIYQPHIVTEIRTPAGDSFVKNPQKILREFSLAKEVWDFLDNTLIQVVEEGTGQPCKISGIKIGGKTGTAQNPQGKDHGWFVAYAPVGNPIIAVSVFVEHGLHGSVSAAPVARRVILTALSEAGLIQEGQTPSVPLSESSGD